MGSKPDFQKITQMIKSTSRDRYVIVEKGKPTWVVLSMDDYEKLVEKKKDASKFRRRRNIEEALTSYRDIIEKGEEVEEDMMEEDSKVWEPEFYFESVEESSQEKPAKKEQELSTSEKEEPIEFDEIPF